MANIPFLDLTQPIQDENGNLTTRFRTWVNDMNRLIPIEGDGSPEGVIEALIGKEYRDISGATGLIFYGKDLADIAGDKSKGWILL